jgi:hypothetical protein
MWVGSVSHKCVGRSGAGHRGGFRPITYRRCVYLFQRGALPLEFLCADEDICGPPMNGESNVEGAMNVRSKHRLRALQQPALGRRRLGAPDTIARAYDHVGPAYTRYADGEEADDPASATVRSARADSIVWQTLRAAIDELRNQGVSRLRILDAGCGPGTWLMRIAAYAHRQGLGIEVVGFDISGAQLAIARKRASSLLARSRRTEAAQARVLTFSRCECTGTHSHVCDYRWLRQRAALLCATRWAPFRPALSIPAGDLPVCPRERSSRTTQSGPGPPAQSASHLAMNAAILRSNAFSSLSFARTVARCS